MLWKVSWTELGNQPIEVDARDRWEAVSKASELLGLVPTFSINFLNSRASVKRLGMENLGRRRAGEKDERQEKIKEIKERARRELADLVGGDCPVCGTFRTLVTHHWREEGQVCTQDICQSCNLKLREPKVLKVFKAYPPFEIQKVFVEACDGIMDSLATGELGPGDTLGDLIEKKCRKVGLDPSGWLRERTESPYVPKPRLKKKG